MTDRAFAIGTTNRRALAALLALAMCTMCATRARADVEREAEAQAAPSARVEWNDDWARFRPWEYAATGALWTQSLFVRFLAPLNRERGTLGLDEQIVEALNLEGTPAAIAATIGDVGYIGSIVYRLLDSTVVPGLIWGNGDVALQMTLIDLEGFAVSAFILFNAQIAYGRERPQFRDCPESAAEGVGCDNETDGRYRSFIAGHTLIASTAAGLTCVHHSHLPLYGGGLGDDLACAGMIGVAIAVGLARISAEKHYPTDTLLAWAIGALAGYVVPSALHYGFGSASRPAATARHHPARDTVRMAIIPHAGSSTAGAMIAGTF